MDRDPDVEIAADVKAAEVRFERKPEVTVKAYADPPGDAESSSERENLPDELDPGVSYRDVAVRWRAAAWLRDAERVDEDAERGPGDS